MGGGAPLGYLNKKTWHPGRIQNQERVWLAEQTAAAEQRKVDELRAEREEERAREELEALAQGAGVRKREEKLDWMYQGGVAASKKVEEEQLQREKDDEARLSREEREKSERERGHQRWLTQDGNTNTNNEIWQRLHGDPLMMMKQQEMQARRSIVSNPVKMDAVRRRVEDEKRRKDDKKRSKRERKEKKEGKEKKEAREQKKSRRHEDNHHRYEDNHHRYEDNHHRHEDNHHRYEDRHNHTLNHSHHHDHRRREEEGTEEERVHPPGRTPNYGLSHSASAPEHLTSRTNTTAIEENRKRLEDAARRHEEEARLEEQRKTTRRGHHTKTARHKTKARDLSEDEKKRRLEEMMRNSTHVDIARRNRVETHTKTAQAEEHALLNRPR